MPRGVTLQSCVLQIGSFCARKCELFIGLAVPALWLTNYYIGLASI